MMHPDVVNELVGSLALMRFFPSDLYARAALVETLGEMCETEDQVRWLVKRVRALYGEWPGEREMRACYCARFKPKDGIDVGSSVFLDGIPSENPERNREIEGPVLKQLPGGHVASEDPALDVAVALLVNVNSVARSFTGPATAEEIAAAPEWLKRLEGYDSPQVAESPDEVARRLAARPQWKRPTCCNDGLLADGSCCSCKVGQFRKGLESTKAA